MPEPVASPDAITQPVNPPTPDVKPGIKTTELYLAILALGGLMWALQEVVRMLPAIASTPGMPGWATAVLGVAPVGIGWLMTVVAKEYGQLRAQLKLGADPAAEQVVTPAQAVAAINK